MIHTRITSSYEHDLARAFYYIANRGIYTDQQAIALLRQKLIDEVVIELGNISKVFGCDVWRGADKTRTGVNINSSTQLIEKFKELGLPVKKKRGKNGAPGRESVDELSLLKVFAETDNPAIKSLLRIREIDAVLNKFIDCQFFQDTYYSCYSVASTVTGRRGSTQHILGLGNNAQNIPKYNDIGKALRKAFIARPGCVLFQVDQKWAEDWIVCALSENHNGLNEMLAEVDRHSKLASFLFSKPLDQVLKYPDRFLGKKFRHANNYGMGKNTASEAMAKEGFAYTPDQCQYFIDKVNEFDPSIRGVFHEYVKQKLYNTRILQTPLGRERAFFGLRNKDENIKVLHEAYSYIPQSSVGDNNGLALLFIENENNYIIQECHDSILQEPPDDEKELVKCLDLVQRAYDREFKFHNGITVKIPIEAEVGFSLGTMETLKELTEDCLIETYRKAKKKKLEQQSINLEKAAMSRTEAGGNAEAQELVGGVS